MKKRVAVTACMLAAIAGCADFVAPGELQIEGGRTIMRGARCEAPPSPDVIANDGNDPAPGDCPDLRIQPDAMNPGP
jgi:hypothetical protein